MAIYRWKGEESSQLTTPHYTVKRIKSASWPLEVTWLGGGEVHGIRVRHRSRLLHYGTYVVAIINTNWGGPMKRRPPLYKELGQSIPANEAQTCCPQILLPRGIRTVNLIHYITFCFVSAMVSLSSLLNSFFSPFVGRKHLFFLSFPFLSTGGTFSFFSHSLLPSVWLRAVASAESNVLFHLHNVDTLLLEYIQR